MADIIPGTNAKGEKFNIDAQIKAMETEKGYRSRMLFTADSDQKKEYWRGRIEMADVIILTLKQVKEVHHPDRRLF